MMQTITYTIVLEVLNDALLIEKANANRIANFGNMKFYGFFVSKCNLIEQLIYEIQTNFSKTSSSDALVQFFNDKKNFYDDLSNELYSKNQNSLASQEADNYEVIDALVCKLREFKR